MQAIPERNIGIVIITYNRPDDLCDLLENINGLEQKEALLQEVIVVNNHSSVSYEKAIAFINNHPALPVRYETTSENLGVSGGRNFAIGRSSADILVFLDDDALFSNSDALLRIQAIFQKSDDDHQPGIVSFKVLYYETRDWQVNAFAHKDFAHRKSLPSFPTYYFTGCAHAMKKEVFTEAGLYPEDFFYGMEEYDLSYRAINRGFQIWYDASVEILHKESPLGRLPGKEKLRGMWVNKSKVAWTYLPRIYSCTTAVLWSLEYLRRTRFDLAGWAKGWKQVLRIPGTTKRSPLGPAARSYLQQTDARLWF